MALLRIVTRNPRCSMGRTAYLAWASVSAYQATQVFCLAERESRARRTKGESVLGIYAGLGVSLLFALLFGRADRR